MKFRDKFTRADALRAAEITAATYQNWLAAGYAHPYGEDYEAGKWRRFGLPDIVRLRVMKAVADAFGLRPSDAVELGYKAEGYVRHRYMQHKDDAPQILYDGKVAEVIERGTKPLFSDEKPKIIIPLRPIVDGILDRLGITFEEAE